MRKLGCIIVVLPPVQQIPQRNPGICFSQLLACSLRKIFKFIKPPDAPENTQGGQIQHGMHLGSQFLRVFANVGKEQRQISGDPAAGQIVRQRLEHRPGGAEQQDQSTFYTGNTNAVCAQQSPVFRQRRHSVPEIIPGKQQYRRILIFRVETVHIVTAKGTVQPAQEFIPLLLYQIHPVLSRRVQNLFQGVGFQGLQQIVRHLQPNGFPGIFKLAEAGHDVEECLGIQFLGFLDGRQAVDSRQLNVHQNQIEQGRLHLVHHFRTGICMIDTNIL